MDDDLHARLVAAGVELLAAEGIAALSLREIARRAGVSHGAPRRHFPTHLSLLSAIAREGFARLTARLTALPDAGDPRERLTGMALAYVTFARTDPGMFELMFRHDLLRSDHLGLREASLPLFRLLTGLVPDADPVAAGALWANLHGTVQLWAWGSLPLATGVDDIEPLVRAALAAHLGAAR